jgi:hypothetical protein
MSLPLAFDDDGSAKLVVLFQLSLHEFPKQSNKAEV